MSVLMFPLPTQSTSSQSREASSCVASAGLDKRRSGTQEQPGSLSICNLSLPRAKSQPAGYRQLFLPFFFFLNKKKGVPKGSGLLDVIRRITGDLAGRAAVKGGSGYVVKGSTDRTDVIFRKAPAPKLTCSKR